MTQLTVDGQAIAVDEEGYLVDPANWNREVALELALRENVTLNERHWAVLDFMRSFYEEHQVAPDARFVIRFLAAEFSLGNEARAALFDMFPYGYVKQACKIAGMRRPRAWSTG